MGLASQSKSQQQEGCSVLAVCMNDLRWGYTPKEAALLTLQTRGSAGTPDRPQT